MIFRVIYIDTCTMASIQDKVTIITGASSGIGEVTAVLFAESKAKLVLTARNVDNLNRVAKLCQEKGLSANNVLVVPCDVTKEESLNALVEETVKKFGRIDILINNAGKGAMGNVMATSSSQLDDIMDTNFKSIYKLCRLCVPHLTKTQGSIVNVSSIAGQRAGPNISAYCISKAALDMLTRLLALELAPQKVRVNSVKMYFAEVLHRINKILQLLKMFVSILDKVKDFDQVSPGFILTKFAENAGWSSDMTANYLERLKVLQPLGGAGQPEDVAKAIKFLASNEASFTTGHLLFVDSGRHAGLPV